MTIRIEDWTHFLEKLQCKAATADFYPGNTCTGEIRWVKKPNITGHTVHMTAKCLTCARKIHFSNNTDSDQMLTTGYSSDDIIRRLGQIFDV